eukprot:TRINITY_DN70023_c0_g1_i1.p1 TRINITY_DN70023_c0_g1~~TRINITY_DN70023_c0_g1_i1.p1  ORF type:complete len:305 (-),score=13.65 TRINITY_DN70023_c0_g1_i1:462-1274(-)
MASMGARASNPLVIEGRGKASAAVIFLHGLGDTSAGWAPVCRQLSPHLPHVKFILPTAPSIPVTLNGGMVMPAWFDIISLSFGGPEDRPSITKSSNELIDLVIATATDKTNPIPLDRIVFGGFSQGGAISYHALLSLLRRAPVLPGAVASADVNPNSPAGVVALSTWLPLREDVMKELEAPAPAIPGQPEETGSARAARATTRLFHGHGSSDPLVAAVWGKKSFDATSELLPNPKGGKHIYRSYHGMAHSACDEEVTDLGKWLLQTLPPV